MTTADVVTTPIRTLLVANRGEIARRIMRTARAMGMATAAVYSDADADSPHVAEADMAVRLPGVAPVDTYLRSALILDAAARCGADAIHPGYGFLSESGDFARVVTGAGFIWVGPPADAIDAMGSKIGSKQIMRAAGVPTLPSIDIEGSALPEDDHLMSDPAFDVLGLGCAAVDDLLYVDVYPKTADVKVRVRRRERQCGGLTATALVAAARLGSRCAYAGILGGDENSQFILDAMGFDAHTRNPELMSRY